MQLRPYQQAAITAVYEHLRTRDDNPCVVLPTGAGKAVILAAICRDAVLQWNGRVLVMAHVKELLEQSADKLRAICPELRCGIYSAGLNSRNTQEPVIIAGIQSVYRRACDLGPFDLIIIDEAHLLPPEGEGMYRQFLADALIVNPSLRIIGLTATPYRMKSGVICTPDHFLNHVCYEIGIRELIRDGYLSPLMTRAGRTKADTSQLHVRGGEFVADEAEALMDQDELVKAACREILELTTDRRSVLIFTAGVRHGQHVQSVLQHEHGVECGFVTGESSSTERQQLLTRFREGHLKYLSNVGVLTTGFDAPGIDCVVLLRPTMSPGLFCQLVGRGFQRAPGKQDCLILDFGGNVLRHGPVDAIRIEPRSTGHGEAIAKECPSCQAVIAAGYSCCPACGYEFPPPDRQQHDAKATQAGILSGQSTEESYDVLDVFYRVHRKKDGGPDAPLSMRVDYQLGLNHWQSEFICFEHTGFARRKAETWWQQRSPDPIPDTAEAAVILANAGALRLTNAITVRSVAGERFDRIVKYDLAEMPDDPQTEAMASTISDDDVPF